MVMAAGAEVVDRGIGDAVLVEPLDEVHVAGAVLDPQVPAVVPEMELRGFRHSGLPASSAEECRDQTVRRKGAGA